MAARSAQHAVSRHDDGNADTFEAADRVCGALVRLLRLLHRAAADTQPTASARVESSAYILLFHLVTDGPKRSSALAESVHADPSTVSRQVAALVREGLIERFPDPYDGRASLLAATAAGERLFHVHREERNRHVARILDDWDPADRTQFAELLEQFNTGLEHHPMRASKGAGRAADREGTNA